MILEEQMRYLVNNDTPTQTTIHDANSRDPRCQKREKSPENGQWYDCQTEGELVNLVSQLPQQQPAIQLRACQICKPVFPASLALSKLRT
jgi:hypothetical protein